MRPRFHFTPRSGWINDPHGVVAGPAGYDLYYQYVPGSTEWRPNCHWGHAVGTDLVSWAERPVAIAPGDGDDGVWTGSVVADPSGARAFYTSVLQPDVSIGSVRVATQRPEGTWEKGAIVARAPEGLGATSFRDPYVFRDGSQWRMLVGAALAPAPGLARAAVLSYESNDLESWSFAGETSSRDASRTDPVWTGSMWECPQLLRFDDRAVLLVGVWDADELHHVAYAVGDYADGQFSADGWRRLTWGPGPYAPTYFRDGDGRECLMFWLRDVGDPASGWMGAHSLPYVATLRGDVLQMEPHPDLLRHRSGRIVDGVSHHVAADVEWAGRGTLDIESGSQRLVRLVGREGTLEIEVDSRAEAIPRAGSAVRVVVDGPTLEISTDLALFACAIKPAGPNVTIGGKDVEGWDLN